MGRPGFGRWLAKRYKVEVQDMEKTKFPWFWRNFSFADGLTIKGKTVYIRGLRGGKIKQRDLDLLLVHEIMGHIPTQRKYGWLGWPLKPGYLYRYCWASFRRKDEVRASIFEMELYHILGLDIQGLPYNRAQVLRGSYLIGKKQYKIAKAQLIKARDEILSGERRDVKRLYDIWESGR
jgi:hypothetical protein